MGEVIQLNVKEETPKEVISTKSISINSLLDRAKDIHLQSKDYMVKKANSKNIRFNDALGFTYITEDGVRQSPISRHALSQICTKVGVPARYIDKCIASGRLDLAQDNINSWLEDYNKDLFIREYDGGIRGVLSNKYSVCDSHEILDVVNNTINLNNYEVKGSFLNEERLHLRLINKEMLPINDEDLFAGLFIDSSDVGRSILTVRFGIYKQVCTNGLVIARASGTLFEQRHIGISTEEFQQGLVASLNRVDELTEYAIGSINRTRERYNHWSVYSDEHPEEIQEFVNYIRQQTNLSENSAYKVIDLMKNKYEDNRWGLINSITEVAQDFSLERRLELERIAGNMLSA